MRIKTEQAIIINDHRRTKKYAHQDRHILTDRTVAGLQNRCQSFYNQEDCYHLQRIFKLMLHRRSSSLFLTLCTPGDGLPTLRKLPTLLGVC